MRQYYAEFTPLFPDYAAKNSFLQEARDIYNKPKHKQLSCINKWCATLTDIVYNAPTTVCTVYFLGRALTMRQWFDIPKSVTDWDWNEELSPDVQRVIKRDFGGLIKDIESYG